MSHDLTCVCVTRNRGSGSKSDGTSFLLTALNSYLATIGKPAYLIVINDASTDDTEGLVDRWVRDPVRAHRCDHTFTTLHLDKHHGIGGAMNAIIRSRLCDDAKYVVRFDDDIVFDCPGWGRRIIDTFERAPDRLVSLGGMQCDPRGWITCFGDRLIGPCYRHHWAGAHRKSIEALSGKPDLVFPVQSVMGAFGAFRVSALREIGFYDKRFATLRCETEDVHCEFLRRGWHAGVRFGLDITHWSDGTFGMVDPASKRWGLERLDETWFEKWGFQRTGRNNHNEYDYELASRRVKEIRACGHELLIKHLWDWDFDEVPGVVGQYTVPALIGGPKAYVPAAEMQVA